MRVEGLWLKVDHCIFTSNAVIFSDHLGVGESSLRPPRQRGWG